MLREEVRSLCSQLARTVLSNELDRHGVNLPDGVVGDEIRQAIDVMDAPIAGILRHLSSGDCAASTSARCIRMVERVEAGRQ